MSQTHVADRVAPVAVAGGAAHGANLRLIHRAGGQAVEGHGAGVGEHAGGLHRAGRAAGSDDGIAHLVAAGGGHRLDLHEKLAGVAVVHVDDEGLVERDLGVGSGHGVEAAGQQRGHVVVAVLLHEGGKLAEHPDERVAFAVLVRRGRRAPVLLRRDGGGEAGEGRLQVRLGHGRGGVGGVAVEAVDDSAGGFLKGMVGRVAES